MISVPCYFAKGIADLRARIRRCWELLARAEFWATQHSLDQRLLKLEDNENNAINLCRSLYDKDRETKYVSPIRVLFGGYSSKRKTSLSWFMTWLGTSWQDKNGNQVNYCRGIIQENYQYGGGHRDFRFCGFEYFFDRFFGFCVKRLRFFGFGVQCGLLIFRFLASGFRIP